jgi:hypothetical protein
MRRSFNVVLAGLLVFACATTLPAQRGGFHGGGGFRGGGVGVAPRSAPGNVFRGNPVVTPGFLPAPIPPGRVISPGRVAPFAVGRPHRTVIVPPVISPFLGFGYYSPFGYSPFGYSPYGYSPYGFAGSIYAPPAYSEPAYVSPSTQQPAVSQNEVDLSYQVGRLTQEVEQLQQNIRTYQAPVPTPSAGNAQPAVPVVLVFRDGRRMEIQNYAIVGQTLWVLDERSSTKISLADLDLDATQAENRSRGIRFLMPAK